MASDLIITWPKSRPLQSYLDELAKAEKAGLVINYRVAHVPAFGFGAWAGRPGRCYVVHDGAVRGYNEILYVTHREEGEVTDPLTDQSWPAGNYIVRDPRWYPINPVPMAGFRGFRYATAEWVAATTSQETT